MVFLICKGVLLELIYYYIIIIITITITITINYYIIYNKKCNIIDNLFTRKETQINKIKYMYYILNEEILLEHINIMNIFNNNLIIFN